MYTYICIYEHMYISSVICMYNLKDLVGMIMGSSYKKHFYDTQTYTVTYKQIYYMNIQAYMCMCIKKRIKTTINVLA